MNPEHTSKCPYHAMLKTVQPHGQRVVQRIQTVLSYLLPKETETSKNLYPLFENGNINNIERTHHRPLDILSDMVFEREGIDIKDVENLLQNVDENFYSLSSEDQKLAVFDLKILYSRLIHQGYKSDVLRKKIRNYNTHLKLPDSPVPLYHELVFLNPQEDIRTFLGGEDGYQEYHFYLGHSLIEKEYEAVLQTIEELICNLHDGDSIDYKTIITMVSYHLDTANNYMRMYNKKFSKDSFQKFRHFFNIPDTLLEPGEKPLGPSGVNMGSMVVLNQLLQGQSNLESSSYMKSFGSQEIGLHPEKDRNRLEVLRQGGYSSLFDLAKQTNSKEILQLCEIINNKIHEFLQVHLGTVMKFIPEAYNNESALGTGGFPLKQSLTSSIQQKEGFATRLKSLLLSH